jgi:FAD binding domain-containing protein
MLDLSLLKGIRVDPAHRTARAEAGVTWAEFDAETQQLGQRLRHGLNAAAEECQLRDAGPKVWHHDTDSNQPPAGERTSATPRLST